MNKLYFKYGAMGSSKTAQALMCKYNYEQKGFRVYLAKPALDTRDVGVVRSRIGLEAKCDLIYPDDNLIEKFDVSNYDVIIIDEVQFLSTEQIEQLKELTAFVPVLCYGLLTDFRTYQFEGSKRLVELADSIMEVKSVCKCGRKATVNARILDGKVTTDGDVVAVGGDERYIGMCFNCYKNAIENNLDVQDL